MSKLGVKLSKAGSMISLVCVVHCALTPLVLLALPLLAAQYGGVLEGLFGAVFSHSFEWVFLGVIVVVAGFGVLATYPVHGDRRPAMLTVVGFLILLSTRLFVELGTSLEISGDLIGASIIAWGGFLTVLCVTAMGVMKKVETKCLTRAASRVLSRLHPCSKGL